MTTNKKRDFPLFIIDVSRAHGRGEETDYISCTDKECPFVASVEMMDEDDYKRLYKKDDAYSIWSNPHNGIRMLISIISDVPQNKVRIKTLLKKALKEVMIRRTSLDVDTSNVSDNAVVHFADLLIEQAVQSIRMKGEQAVDRTVLPILMKIKKDYGGSD